MATKTTKEREKTPSNAVIVAAIIEAGTVSAAAEKLGITPETIYSRRKEPDFRSCYADAKAELLRAAVMNANRRLSEAVNTVVEIMNDQSANPATRLQAAQTLLSTGTKLSDTLTSTEAANRRIGSSWDILGEEL